MWPLQGEKEKAHEDDQEDKVNQWRIQELTHMVSLNPYKCVLGGGA